MKIFAWGKFYVNVTVIYSKGFGLESDLSVVTLVHFSGYFGLKSP